MKRYPKVIDYRPEIDGLRAVAVIPVILFHAGLQTFSGGYVGVDVFFVISGYLITTIILTELELGKFSIINFYERRARRILPALFIVMGASSVLSYLWMLPDELENYGQSLFATSFFSNNILLALTSGYWSLAAEFKPLLHTWSLGIEEQYYFVMPLLLIFGYRLGLKNLALILMALFLMSIVSAAIGSKSFPQFSFYLLPTRAWELLLGSFVAIYFKTYSLFKLPNYVHQLGSGGGLLLILAASLLFTKDTPTPSLYTLIPTLGAVLVIVFARAGTVANAVLRSRLLVLAGLVSYSAYLWHWPIFAFARIYNVAPPSTVLMSELCAFSFVLAYLSWRFVEGPFRDKESISRYTLFRLVIVISTVFSLWGYFLHKAHGLPSRLYPPDVASSADIYISYNESVYKYKAEAFSNDGRTRLLIVGNSFARDFVNMTVENFNLGRVELIYRDDFPRCIQNIEDKVLRSLYGHADILVFASGGDDKHCFDLDVALVKKDKKRVFYIGPKQFGYNLNWLARVPLDKRANLYNPVLSETTAGEKRFKSYVPSEYAISLLDPIVNRDLILVTDDQGRLISPDRSHLTKYGAQLLGKAALVPSHYGKLLLSLQ